MGTQEGPGKGTELGWRHWRDAWGWGQEDRMELGHLEMGMGTLERHG